MTHIPRVAAHGPSQAARHGPCRALVAMGAMGALLGAFAAAHAGFIDERSAGAKPAAAAQSEPVPDWAKTPAVDRSAGVAPPVGGLVGEFGPQWDKPMKGSGSKVPLPAMLNVLQLGLSAQFEDISLQELTMEWSLEEPARAVLTRFAREHGLVLTLEGSTLSVARRGTAGSPAAGGAVPAAVIDPASAAPALKRFEVRLSDVRLHVAMQRWAADSGVRLRWDAERHLLISAPTVFEAPDALAAIGMALATPGIAQSEYPLEVCEYPNVPPLLRITRQGEQARDCPN